MFRRCRPSPRSCAAAALAIGVIVAVLFGATGSAGSSAERLSGRVGASGPLPAALLEAAVLPALSTPAFVDERRADAIRQLTVVLTIVGALIAIVLIHAIAVASRSLRPIPVVERSPGRSPPRRRA